MNRPNLDLSTIKKINVREFGAVGDGKTDDLNAFRAAIQQAIDCNAALVIDESEYYLSAHLTLCKINVISNNATLLYYGTEKNTPCISMEDHVNIFGHLNIYAHDVGGVHHGERCCMAFGNYDSGKGAHHCYVESLTCLGGIRDANGVLITGDSSDISMERITVPRGTKIKRGFLAHWGNANAATTYRKRLKENPNTKIDVMKDSLGPITHPHNIHIGRVECTGLMPLPECPRNKDTDNGAVAICACHDITVDEVIVEDACHSCMITGADHGFEFSSPEERERGQHTLHIGKITAKGLTSAGIYVTGFAWFNEAEGVKTKLTIDEAYVEAAEGPDHWHGQPALGASKVNQLTVGSLIYKGYDIAVDTSKSDRVTVKAITKL